jgi:RNA polymerase sigma-70 factor (ECF subfamily)
MQPSGGGVSDLSLACQLDDSLSVDLPATVAADLSRGDASPGVAAELSPDARSAEATWVQRAREGDLEAFDAIMICYEARLLRFLTGLAGDVEIARELCQDTFLSAYQALPRMQGELRLSAWLHTIALNHARSYHRRRRLRRFLPLEDEHHHAPASCNVEESVVTHDMVKRVLARLPQKYAHPLLLQIASGLSCREIAEVLGCSEGAVKVRLLRAREAFRRIYDAEERGQ